MAIRWGQVAYFTILGSSAQHVVDLAWTGTVDSVLPPLRLVVSWAVGAVVVQAWLGKRRNRMESLPKRPGSEDDTAA